MVTDKGNLLGIVGTSSKVRKTIDGLDVLAAVSYLSPSTTAGLGINTCPMAGSCKDGECLTSSGRLPLHKDYQVLKTRAFFGYPREFLGQMIREIKVAAFKAYLEGKVLFMRLNGTSDIRWEKYLDLDKLTEETQGLGGFYDYTKFPLSSRLPSAGYHLTYSVDEQDVSLSRAGEYRRAGYPIAVVSTKEDHKWLTGQDNVTDGDVTDFRWLDTGVVVLKAKKLVKGKSKGYKKAGRGLVRTARQILELI
tara:strand:- start:2276 stop:3025 length:750 start_codon:yes stop_codon:yes gene_type:complete